MNTTQQTRYLRCVLTERELLEYGKQSAELTRAIVGLEEDKARISKDYGARIAAKETDRTGLTDRIVSGYEFRNVPVTVKMHTPRAGQKEVWRDDTGELVATETMSSDELQEQLPLEEPAPPAPPEFNPDTDVDDVTLERLTTIPTGDDNFKSALEEAGIATLKAALEKDPSKRARKAIEKQLAKLEDANTAVGDVPDPVIPDFQWAEEERDCLNPAVLTIPADEAGMKLAIQLGRGPDNLWRVGVIVDDLEQRGGEECNLLNVGYQDLATAAKAACVMADAALDTMRRAGAREAVKPQKWLKEHESEIVFSVESAMVDPFAEISLAAGAVK